MRYRSWYRERSPVVVLFIKLKFVTPPNRDDIALLFLIRFPISLQLIPLVLLGTVA